MTKKQKKMLKRIIVSAVILFVTMLLPFRNEFKLILFLFSYLIAGYDIILKSFNNIRHFEIFDENFLMLIASIGAFLIGEYSEAVAVAVLYQVGELFQGYAVNKSRKSIKDLMNIKPDYANIEIDGKIEKVSPEGLKAGDIFIVNSGEKIPLDGTVVSGEATVDTSNMTGESRPFKAESGSRVVSGSVSLNGMLKVKAESEFASSTVSKVLKLVEEVSEKKSKSENFITKFSRYYTPSVVVIAGILGILVPLIFDVNAEVWVRKALVFLVVSCPCALIISVPLSFFGGIGFASKNGILIKGSQYIESLSKVETVILDKTGTLTEGEFKITEINGNEDELLYFASASEKFSNHPIAEILKKYKNNAEVSDFKEISGKGVSAKIDGNFILAGNEKLMADNNVSYSKNNTLGTVVYVSKNNEYLGNIVIADKIKDDSKEAVSLLKKNGVKKTVLLTGDKKEIGEKIGNAVGIDEMHSELLPQDKVKYLEELKAKLPKDKCLAFTGDGINDAPSLAYADVGIAMGAIGSDAAIEAADVVIMDDNLKSLSKAIRIAKKTMAISKQNIVFSLSVKFLFLLLGAFGIANLWGAVFADVGVTVIAIINAFRTMKNRP